MEEIKIKGGARIGLMSASWPFATMTITREGIKLEVTLLGDYEFKVDDIEAIKPYGFIPVIGRGIKIIHNIDGYKNHIVFWIFNDRDKILSQIEAMGYKVMR